MWRFFGTRGYDERDLCTQLLVALGGGSHRLPYRRVSLHGSCTRLVESALGLHQDRNGLFLVAMVGEGIETGRLDLLQDLTACEMPGDVASAEWRSMGLAKTHPQAILSNALPLLRTTGAMIAAVAWTRPVDSTPRGSRLSFVQGLPGSELLEGMKRMATTELRALGVYSA